MKGVVSRPGQRWLSSGGLTLIAQARPQDDGGHSCNTRVRWRIVSLDFGRLLMKHSNNRCALARLFPANSLSSSTRCLARLPLDLWEVAPVRVERVVGFFSGPVVGGDPPVCDNVA